MWLVYRFQVLLGTHQIHWRTVGHYHLASGEKIARERTTPNDDIKGWLREHAKGRWRYRTTTHAIMFVNEADAVHFKMRWYEGRHVA